MENLKTKFSSADESKLDIFQVIKEIEESISELDDPVKKVEQEKNLVETVKNYLEKFGSEAVEDISSQLKSISRKNESLLVRRVNPQNLFKTLDERGDYQIGFNEDLENSGKGYPNAAKLGTDLEGLKIPYTQGLSKIGTGALVLIAGFNPGEMKVDKIDHDELNYMSGRDRELVRKVSGKTSFENIKFIIARYPRSIFPEDMMTEQELENENIKYISRLYKA